jgi:hypothetical protein
VLNNLKALKPQYIGKLEHCGLAMSTSVKGRLTFAKGWSSARLDEWLWQALPKPFAYLDEKYGDPGKGNHWVLTKVLHKKTLERQGDSANGYDFLEAFGDSSTPWNKHSIIIGQYGH